MSRASDVSLVEEARAYESNRSFAEGAPTPARAARKLTTCPSSLPDGFDKDIDEARLSGRAARPAFTLPPDPDSTRPTPDEETRTVGGVKKEKKHCLAARSLQD